MLELYRDAEVTSPPLESEQSKCMTTNRHKAYGTHLSILEPELERKLSPESKRIFSATRLRKWAKWAAFDKKKVEELVKTLARYNDSLDHLTSSVEQSSMSRTLRTHFVAPNELTQLRLLQEAALLAGHDDIYRVALSKCFVQEVYQSEDVCATLEATQLNSIVKSDTSIPDALESWRLEFDRLLYDGVAIMANHTRTTGIYEYPDGRRDPVVVDWSRCRDDSWRRRNPDAFHIRVSNLARTLNRDLLPKGFCVLQCIGYMNGSNTTLGYMFRPPVDAVPGKDPISLHKLLSEVRSTSDIPELGDRFALAKAIASAVFEFHNINWLHKNIQPHNILFWPSKHCSGKIDLRKPYLVGFDLSRSNQPGEATEKPISDKEEDLYRHPSYKGPNATGFKPAYDYYSLGVLLFEIAMWHLVSQTSSRRANSTSSKDKRKPSTGDPDFVEMTVTNAAQDLGRYVGCRYRDAVLACIGLDFDEIWEELKAEDRDFALQQAVQSKVVDAIEYCQA